MAQLKDAPDGEVNQCEPAVHILETIFDCYASHREASFPVSADCARLFRHKDAKKGYPENPFPHRTALNAQNLCKTPI